MSLVLLPFASLALETSRAEIRKIKSFVKSGSVLLATQNKVVYALNAQKQWTPASILKIATAWVAFEILGTVDPFSTKFFLTKDRTLVVSGFGDPFLVSEEWAVIAKTLAKRLSNPIQSIQLDALAFDSVQIPGVTNTSNPYDSQNGALVSNFNTVNFLIDRQGNITSAEPQTPNLPIMQRLGKNLSQGKHRINLAHSKQDSLQYTHELLQFFLGQAGVAVLQKERVFGTKAGTQRLIYQHKQSRSLTTIVQGMMKYSNNFIANQIFLTIGAKQYGYPATLQKSANAMQHFLRKNLKQGKHWKVVEGSGISRQNKVSAQQFLELLKAFEPYQNVLTPYQNAKVKTGTLHGVYTLAGYIQGAKSETYYFVILLNQKDNTRYQILNQLLKLVKSNET